MGSVKKNRFYEMLILIMMLMVSIYMLTAYNAVKFYSLGTDTAGFIDLIRAVAQNGTMVSPIFSSVYSVIPFLTASSNIYCVSDLLSVNQTSNFLQWHPYLITYALALPVKYFGVAPLTIAALINAVNIACSLALIYCFLRGRGLVVWECLSFIFAVVVSQYWVGAIAGQFYFDRLFLLPGLVLVLYCYQKLDGNYRVWLSVCFFAMLSSVLISERTALMACVLSLGYWLLLVENRLKERGLAIFIFSIVGLVYFIIYMKFFQNSLYYNRLDWKGVLHNITIALSPDGVLYGPTLKWIGIVSPMVILSFAKNWRYGLLTISALAPNLLVTVGGAEKTGFATHYHAGYIPFLVGFAAIGYASLANKVRAHSLPGHFWKKFSKSIFISIAVVVSGLAVSQIKETREMYGTIAWLNSGFDSMVQKRNESMKFVGSLPTDATISSPEWIMPALAAAGISKVDYMPIGILKNKYVIAQYNSEKHLPEIPSYLDPSSKDRISACIQDKLILNYKIKSEAMIGSSRYVIYEKML